MIIEDVWSLAGTLYANGKNVLILDTCCGLDIIRSVTRRKISTFNAAIGIDNQLTNNSLPYNIVLASLYPTESARHLIATERDVSICIEDHVRMARDLRRVHEALHMGGIAPSSPDYTQYDYEASLSSLYHRIIDGAYLIASNNLFVVRRDGRVVQGRAPAKAGSTRQEADCQIFEEVLELGRALQAKGFAGKLVFASSNTRDYCDSGNGGHPRIEIAQDLVAVGGVYAESLEAACIAAT